MTSIVIGLLSLIFVVFMVGSVSAAFLLLISEAQRIFLQHPSLVWLLPLVGLLTGFVYARWGKRWPSTPHILRHTTTHSSTATIPFLTAVMIFIFTVLSQLFGASTGRESTAVQFGAGLADSFRSFVGRKQSLYFSRETFIRCGLSAGFAAVFGVPFAGALFALEATSAKKWPWRHVGLVLLSACGAHVVAMSLGATHKIYPALAALPWTLKLFAQWCALGIIFGLAGLGFLQLLRFFERQSLRLCPAWLRPAVGAVVIVVLTAFVFKNTRYNGLGLPLIEDALTGKFRVFDFVWKSVYTAISSGFGLKGGEVTPLMAIGASLGATTAGWVMLPSVYAASLGLICVFASAAHVPWTGAVMAWEFFGFEAFLPTFLICWIAQRLMGLRSLFQLLDE